MACNIPPVYVERAGTQPVAAPGSIMTIILIAIFVTALAFSLLFLLGTRRQTIKSGAEKEPQEKLAPTVYHEQAGATLASDTVGAGIGRIFRSLDNTINLFFSGLIFLYKRAFNYSGRPAAPAATTVVSQEALPQNAPAMSTPAQAQPPVEPLPPVTQPPPGYRPYGLQAIIDIMGEGIEIALTGMANGIVFIFEGFINLFKWMFRIDR